MTAIEWSKRTVWLEPARKVARLAGWARPQPGPRCLPGHSDRTRRGAFDLRHAVPARASAAGVQEAGVDIPAGTHLVSSRVNGASIRTWTFAGTRANRTYALCAEMTGNKVRFDALSVQAPVSALTAVTSEGVALTDDELAAFAEAVKFSGCLPRKATRRNGYRPSVRGFGAGHMGIARSAHSTPLHPGV